MAKTYDIKNQLKEKYEKIIFSKDKEIEELKEKLSKLTAQNDELRKKLYDAGEGKGNLNRLQNIIVSQERDKKTLENKIKKLTYAEKIAVFSSERRELIAKIQKLSFKNNLYDKLAFKFKDGLKNVIEIAYRIKINSADGMDYYTFLFRDDIIGLFEKMLKALTNKSEDSAAKYMVKLKNKVYTLPKQYYERFPKLKDEYTLNNILNLANLESTGYHGSALKVNRLVTDSETNEKVNPNRFLNIPNDDKLDAIFTLIAFMYDVFTNKDHEQNLLVISSSWFKTI